MLAALWLSRVPLHVLQEENGGGGIDGDRPARPRQGAATNTCSRRKTRMKDFKAGGQKTGGLGLRHVCIGRGIQREIKEATAAKYEPRIGTGLPVGFYDEPSPSSPL